MESVGKPVWEPVVELVVEPVGEPDVESVVEPVGEPDVESDVGIVGELFVDSGWEPVSELFAKQNIMRSFIKKTIVPEDAGKNALFAGDDSTLKFINKQENGEVFTSEFYHQRNYQQLKMFWAICGVVAENYRKEIFRDLDHSRKVAEYVKLKIGFVDYRIVMKDKVHIKTKSISYAKLSQDEWKKFLDDALIVLENISEINKDQLVQISKLSNAEIEED